MNYINQSINLLIFVGLILFARKPIMKMVRDRARRIRNDIEDSQNMLQKAESDFASINEKLSSIESHIEDLRKEATDAVKLKEEMKERGAVEAQRIVATAEQSIEEQLRRAKRELWQLPLKPLSSLPPSTSSKISMRGSAVSTLSLSAA